MSRRYVHDEECALTLDVAATADEDLTDYRVPVCSCRERQKARRRMTSATTGSGSRGTSASEGTALGGGNFYKADRGLSDGSDRGFG